MNDILDRSSWSFDKRLVLLKRFTSDVTQKISLFNGLPLDLGFQYPNQKYECNSW